MENKTVRIKMFHSLEVEYDGKVINELDNRSQKMWLLLAYIIYFRQKSVSQEMLLSDIWSSDDSGNSVLKTTLHRLRAMLSETFGEGFGREFICCQKRMYSVDETYQISCDFEEFDASLKAAREAATDAAKMEHYKKAFELYRGDFLSTFPEVSWITPISIYFHYLYLDLVRDMLEISERRQHYTESIEILRRAGEVEKYEESIYVHLIRNLIRTDKYKEAVQVYKHLNDMMSATYGVQPSEEAKALYHEAMHALSTELVEINEIPVLVMEQEIGRGALYCEFDFFKALYRAYSRGTERTGNAISLVLINITDIRDKFLSKRSLNVCVANLKELLCANLRSGDIVSMCTPSQFVLLLPNADEANAENAMERIKKTFYKQYPHTPAKLIYVVKSMAED